MITTEVLGGLRFFRDGVELPDLPGKPKRAALLVYIAVERNVGRDRICSLLWPDRDESAARHALSQTLVELRRDLIVTWAETRGDRLVATPKLHVDLAAFEAAIAAGDATRGIELYRGPFLDGIEISVSSELERWIDGKRSEVHRKARDAFRTLTAETDSPHAAVKHARAWVQHDPLDDEAQHALIQALANAGQRTLALQQYKDYEGLILRELEVEPLDKTKELVERLKGGQGQQRPRPAPPGAPPKLPQASHAEERGEDDGNPDFGPDLSVVRHLRSGATGDVYLVREPGLRRQVAAKVLYAALAEHAIASARFEREAQSAARITHPHVATVFRVGTTTDGRPFFTMPYVKGVTLADRLRARGALEYGEAARVLAEVASALAAAHAVGVIHRDVRPETVLYEDKTGRTCLADFGIAGVLDSWSGEEATRLTFKGEVLGSLEYISPEQQDGLDLDGRSDVYSLGVLGCELLLGRSTRDVADLERAYPKDELVELLGRAMAHEPQHRPSASDFADAMARIRTGIL